MLTLHAASVSGNACFVGPRLPLPPCPAHQVVQVVRQRMAIMTPRMLNSAGLMRAGRFAVTPPHPALSRASSLPANGLRASCGSGNAAIKAGKCGLRCEIPLIGSRLGTGWQIIRRQPRG